MKASEAVVRVKAWRDHDSMGLSAAKAVTAGLPDRL